MKLSRSRPVTLTPPPLQLPATILKLAARSMDPQVSLVGSKPLRGERYQKCPTSIEPTARLLLPRCRRTAFARLNRGSTDGRLQLMPTNLTPYGSRVPTGYSSSGRLPLSSSAEAKRLLSCRPSLGRDPATKLRCSKGQRLLTRNDTVLPSHERANATTATSESASCDHPRTLNPCQPSFPSRLQTGGGCIRLPYISIEVRALPTTS